MMNLSILNIGWKPRLEKGCIGRVVIGALLIAQSVWINAAAPAHARDVSTDARERSPACICPATSEEWHVVPDTMDVPGEVAERVKIRRMVVCEHGVFFKFRAGRRSKSRSWWLAFTPPRREQYRYCLEDDLEGVALELQLTRAVEEATVRYTEFRGEVRQFLGRRYREDKTIRFDRAYGREPICEGVFGIKWRGKELNFGLIPDLYVRR
jgi:hypothetical protein